MCVSEWERERGEKERVRESEREENGNQSHSLFKYFSVKKKAPSYYFDNTFLSLFDNSSYLRINKIINMLIINIFIINMIINMITQTQEEKKQCEDFSIV